MLIRIIQMAVFSLVLTFSLVAAAVDLGVIGQTYPVVEEDVVKAIERKAAQVDWSKYFDKDKMEKRVLAYRPSDLSKLPAAREYRQRLVDMTYTLEIDIPDQHGNVMYPKGYVFNPLDYIDYPTTIVVMDGSDREQVEWFKASKYAKNITVKLIVTDGNYYDLGTELGIPVFYLKGIIASRFRLEYVPSVVKQKGRMMEVTEIDVKDINKKKPS